MGTWVESCISSLPINTGDEVVVIKISESFDPKVVNTSYRLLQTYNNWRSASERLIEERKKAERVLEYVEKTPSVLETLEILYPTCNKNIPFPFTVMFGHYDGCGGIEEFDISENSYRILVLKKFWDLLTSKVECVEGEDAIKRKLGAFLEDCHLLRIHIVPYYGSSMVGWSCKNPYETFLRQVYFKFLNEALQDG